MAHCCRKQLSLAATDSMLVNFIENAIDSVRRPYVCVNFYLNDYLLYFTRRISIVTAVRFVIFDFKDTNEWMNETPNGFLEKKSIF